jgi:hypothetical protein
LQQQALQTASNRALAVKAKEREKFVASAVQSRIARRFETQDGRESVEKHLDVEPAQRFRHYHTFVGVATMGPAIVSYVPSSNSFHGLGL